LPSSRLTRCRYCFSGNAYATSTTILPGTVDLFRSYGKGIYHIGGQLFENTTKRQLNQLIGKFKIKVKLDAAGIR
jgi:hypothetical protein